MFYREAGQFKSGYAADQAMFPIPQDRYVVIAIVAFAFLGVPLIANEYWLQAILIPFLVFSMAAIGLNLLTGYAGQLSLGTGGFMAVGGYMTYKFTTFWPELNIVACFLLSGLCAAGVGVLFGIPSLRIKGFYLAVATLAAQFFLVWTFNKVPWFYNYNPSGTVTAPPRTLFGVTFTGPEASASCALSAGAQQWSWCSRLRRRIWCAGGSGGPGWRFGTWTSRPRSSDSAPSRPSCSLSRSLPSTAASQAR